MKLEDDWHWEIGDEFGYQPIIRQAVREVERLEITVERLEGHVFAQDQEISRLNSMNLFQRIFRWGK